MDIYQLQVSYLEFEDRILLRMNTRSNEEFRLWLTRRMAQRVFPHLTDITTRLNTQDSATAHHDGATPAALAAFKKQESLATADFQTPYRAELASTPLGHAPLLVSKIHLTEIQGTSLRMGFEEQGQGTAPGRAFELTLNAAVMHSLLHLMETAIQQSNWGLPLPAKPSNAFNILAAATPPVYLN
jgi:hypothetical protein